MTIAVLGWRTTKEARHLDRPGLGQRALNQHHVQRLIAHQARGFYRGTHATDHRKPRLTAQPCSYLGCDDRLAFDDQQSNRVVQRSMHGLVTPNPQTQ